MRKYVCEGCKHDRNAHMAMLNDKLMCKVVGCNCYGLIVIEKEEVRYTKHKVSESCHAVIDTTIDSTICYCPKSEYADMIIEGLVCVSKLSKEQVKLSQMEVEL